MESLTVYGPFISRKQAQEQGLTFYFTGKPCKRGHVDRHYTCGGCFVCRRERAAFKGCRNPAGAGRCPVKYAEKKKRATKKTQLKRQDPAHREHRNMLERQRYLRWSTQEKLAATLRARVREAFKWSGIKKSAKTCDLLGCSVESAKRYLESCFLPGMTWENWGQRGWHIDHIRPCASFDLTDPEQQRECFHWSNLQSLWAEDNLRKGARLVA